MKIVRVINSNAVVVSAKDTEFVLLGKNIGLRKKAGQEADEALAEKKFIKINAELSTLFEE